jgi:hypothetical protein
MIVVADSGPLINLARIHRFDLSRNLYKEELGRQSHGGCVLFSPVLRWYYPRPRRHDSSRRPLERPS